MATIAVEGYILDDFSTADNLAGLTGSWAIQSTGGDLTDGCLKSTTITHNETTSFEFTAPEAGYFGFRYKVSSEANYDYFKVFKNGVEIINTSGVKTTYSTSAMFLIAGDVIKFQYNKDTAVSNGSDCFFLERIFLYPDGTYTAFDFSDGLKPAEFIGAWSVVSNTASDSGYSLRGHSSVKSTGEADFFIFNSPTFYLFEGDVSNSSEWSVVNVGVNGETVISKGNTTSFIDLRIAQDGDILSFVAFNEQSSSTVDLHKLFLLPGPGAESTSGSTTGGTIEGNTTNSDGTAADYVRAFRWPAGTLIDLTQPATDGSWQISGIPYDTPFGISYLSSGFKPSTHGPYELVTPYTDYLVVHMDMDQAGTTSDPLINQAAPDINPTVYGAQTLQPGKFNNGIHFDGSGDYIDIPPDQIDLDIQVGEDFTIEMFAKRTEIGSGVIFGKADGNSSACYGIRFGIDTFRFTAYSDGSGGSGQNLSASVVVGQDIWYHIAIARENGLYRMFLDGALVGEGTVHDPFVAPNRSAYIGSLGFPGYEYWYEGDVDAFYFAKGIARYTEPFTPPTAPL